ncbi:hypothetical protein B566_EDAN001633 [Ephemera danica]|nr:hypothetical protein B566_EDAN001633 [Ephemera danica]
MCLIIKKRRVEDKVMLFTSFTMLNVSVLTVALVLSVTEACPSIKSRSSWGSKPSVTPAANQKNPSTLAIIHHSDTPPCTTTQQCEARVRQIQSFHVNNRGWGDIGYNFLIGGDGTIYEGRGWGKVGAHAKGYNSISTGICFIGNYKTSPPPRHLLQLAKDLIACGVTKKFINPNYGLRGHRQVGQTECPGNALYKEIMGWPPLLLTITAELVLTACPNIKARSTWGAKNPKKPLSPLTQNPAPYVIIHHSDSPPCTTSQQCQARVLSIQADHQTSARGFDDIGYTFLIGGDGNVYEGRGWGKSGAHAPNYNSKSVGICVIGDFMATNPPNNMLQLVKDLIACGVDSGKIRSNYKLLGHRQVRATSCPGDKLFNEIKTWPKWSSQP